MLLLLLAYLGGVLTIASPCILPVLPFVFARAGQPFVKSTLPMLAGMAWTPASVSPEQSAQCILDGLRRNERVIRYPRLASVTMKVIGLLPPAPRTAGGQRSYDNVACAGGPAGTA